MSIFKSRTDKMIELHKEKVLKDKMIDSVIENFQTLKPKKGMVEEYRKELETLKPSELKHLVKKMDAMPVINFASKLRKLRKAKAILIHMTNHNGTVIHMIISRYSRYFVYKKSSYVLDREKQYQDLNYKMNCYYYIEGCPVPYKVDNVKGKAELTLDSKAMKTVIKMEYVELLAKISKVKDLIMFAVVMSGISALGVIIIIGMNAKGFGFI